MREIVTLWLQLTWPVTRASIDRYAPAHNEKGTTGWGWLFINKLRSYEGSELRTLKLGTGTAGDVFLPALWQQWQLRRR